MKKNQLTAAMICKNEADTLEGVIKSCPAKQFVIGVDYKSSDDTLKIARKYGHNVFEYEWKDDFAYARNLTLEYAQEDWVIWLDGHEFVSDGTRENFAKLDTVAKDVGILAIKLEMYADGLLEGGRPDHYFYTNKIFRNGLGIHFEYPIHAYATGLPEGYRAQFTDEMVLEHRRNHHLSEARQKQRMEMNAKKCLEFMDRHPEDLRAMFFLVQALVETGDWEQGKVWCERYLELSDWPEERYQIKYFLAHIYLELKEPKKAYDLLLTAHHDDWTRNESYLLLGDICMDFQNWAEAAHWYRLATVFDPPISPMFVWNKATLEVPHMKLASAYGRMGELRKARKHAEIVAEWHPEESARVIRDIDRHIAKASAEGRYI